MQRFMLLAANIDNPEYCRNAAIVVMTLGVLMVGSLFGVMVAGKGSDRGGKGKP